MSVSPDAQDVLIVDVVDLRKLPGMFRKVAEGVLSAEHKKAVEALAERPRRRTTT